MGRKWWQWSSLPSWKYVWHSAVRKRSVGSCMTAAVERRERSLQSSMTWRQSRPKITTGEELIESFTNIILNFTTDICLFLLWLWAWFRADSFLVSTSEHCPLGGGVLWKYLGKLYQQFYSVVCFFSFSPCESVLVFTTDWMAHFSFVRTIRSLFCSSLVGSTAAS